MSRANILNYLHNQIHLKQFKTQLLIQPKSHKPFIQLNIEFQNQSHTKLQIQTSQHPSQIQPTIPSKLHVCSRRIKTQKEKETQSPE